MFAPAHHAAMKHAAAVRRGSACALCSTFSDATIRPARRRSSWRFHPDLVGIQVRVLQRLGRATTR